MAIIIALGGGSGSGKTFLAKHLATTFGAEASLLSNDSYYLDQSRLSVAERKLVNYDDPSSIDEALFAQHLKDFSEGRSIEVPLFDFSTHTRQSGSHTLIPTHFLFVEGIMVLSLPELRKFFNLTVYVEADDDIRLARRISRDITERGRETTDIIRQYLTFVRPAYQRYIAPTKEKADVVFPNNGNNGLDEAEYRRLVERIRSLK